MHPGARCSTTAVVVVVDLVVSWCERMYDVRVVQEMSSSDLFNNNDG